MYAATMEYTFRPEHLAEGLAFWKDTVIQAARQQPGFRALTLLSQANGTMLALGQWDSAAYAEAFMRTGVFKTLSEKFSPWLVRDPQPRLWILDGHWAGRGA